MATMFTYFNVSPEVREGQAGILTISFTTPVIGFGLNDIIAEGIILSNFTRSADGQTYTMTATPIADYQAPIVISVVANTYLNGRDFTPGSANTLVFTLPAPPVPDPPDVSFKSTGADTVYNIAEVGTDGTVGVTIRTGENTKVGDIIHVNGTQYAVTDEVLVNGISLQVAPGTAITASITDATNRSSPVVLATVPSADLTAPVANIAPNAVTDDNIINVNESNSTITLTGKVSGEFIAGESITLTINEKPYQTTVDSTGSFTVDVAGADLAADTDRTIDYSLPIRDAAGNEGIATAQLHYNIDLAPITAPVVQLLNDADNDGVIYNPAPQGTTDYLITLPEGTQEGDMLWVNNQPISVTQDMLSNGYKASIAVTMGETLTIEAYVSDTAGNKSLVGSDTATIDLSPIEYLYHLGANLDSVNGVKDAYGKQSEQNLYRLSKQSDQLYIGYQGKDAAGNLVASVSDGNFQHDAGDNLSAPWILNTAIGDDSVTIRGSQNYGTVAVLGEGNDRYILNGMLDSRLPQGVGAPAADAFILTGLGNDYVVVGGNESGATSNMGIRGGNIYAGSGDDNITVYGNVLEDAIIDLGAGYKPSTVMLDHADIQSLDTASNINSLNVSGSVGNGTSSSGFIYGDVGQDNISISGDISGASVISLGLGNDTVVAKSMTQQAKIELGSGLNDVRLQGSISDQSTVIGGDGGNLITVAQSMTNNATVLTGAGSDQLQIAGNLTGYANVNLGGGDDSVSVAKMIDYAKVVTGDGNDQVAITSLLGGFAQIDMGTGSNEINVNGMSGSARVMASTGDDSFVANGILTGMAMVNLGDGNNHVVVAGLSNGSRIITGTGSDTIDIGAAMTVTGTQAAVVSGDGDDHISFSGGKLTGVIDGGMGTDTMTLTYNANASLTTTASAVTNLSTQHLKGIEVINMAGFNALDIRYSDLLADKSRSGALIIQGSSNDKVDIGSTNLNSETGATASLKDATGGTWAKSGSVTLEGVGYDIYHHAFAGTSTINDVYIQQGIMVI